MKRKEWEALYPGAKSCTFYFFMFVSHRAHCLLATTASFCASFNHACNHVRATITEATEYVQANEYIVPDVLAWEGKAFPARNNSPVKTELLPLYRSATR